jgi:hypothetical protein
MGTDVQHTSPNVVIVPTQNQSDDLIVGEVAFHDGTLTVKVERDDSYSGCTSGPSVSLGLHYENSGDGCAITLDYLDLDESSFVKLINVLTKAFQIEQDRARERGYYDWVEAGRPDYERDPDHPFFREDES